MMPGNFHFYINACLDFAYAAFEMKFTLRVKRLGMSPGEIGILLTSLIFKSTFTIIPLILIYGLHFALITASTRALSADTPLGILNTITDVGQTFAHCEIGVTINIYSYTTRNRVIGIVLFLSATALINVLLK